MPRFDFQSPGAGFIDQITNQLAERKADERQRMLDQLNLNSDRRAAEAAQRQERESQAQLRASQQDYETRRIAALSSGLNIGDTVDRFSPEDQELFNKYGMLADRPGAQVSTETEFPQDDGSVVQGDVQQAPPAPPIRGFVGTPEERDRARRKEQSAKVIAGMLQSQDPQQRAIGESMAKMLEFGDEVPAQFASQAFQPKGHVKVFDQNTGTFKDSGETVGNFDQVVNWTRPPREYRPRNLMPVVGPDGQAGAVDQDSLHVDPRTGMATLPEGWTFVRGGGNGNSQFMPLGVSNGAAESYMEVLPLTEPDENGKVAPGVMLELRTRAAQIIQQAKTSDNVKRVALGFLSDPNSVRDAELSEREALQLEQLLGIIAATPEVRNIYQRNSAVKPKPATPAAPTAPAAPGGRFNPSDAQLGRIR